MACEVCGGWTYFQNYRLCKECYDLMTEGEIIDCPTCGKYHKKDAVCSSQSTAEPVITEQMQKEIKDYAKNRYICKCCGRETDKRPLCEECKKRKYIGEVVKCSYCGKWHRKNFLCENKNTFYDNLQQQMQSKIELLQNQIETQKRLIQNVEQLVEEKDKQLEDQKKIQSANSRLCIAGCGQKSKDDYFFCTQCWKKYKDKTVLIEIKKANNPEVLDAFYGGTQRADDGHIVKSDGEEKIDNALNSLKILHSYEQALFIDELEEPLKPDFYIPEYKTKQKKIENIFIEYWGIEDDPEYEKKKAYKIAAYQKELEKGKDYTFLYIYPKATRKTSESTKSIIKRALDNLEEHKENTIS